jgi:D-alanine-D-alanine ligase
MGQHSSLSLAAEKAGLSFPAFANRLVNVASARYFGTPAPPQISVRRGDIGQAIYSYVVDRRDLMERRVQEWTNLDSRTSDPAGIHEVLRKLSKSMEDLGLRQVKEFTDERSTWTWETKAGLEGGTLLVGHIDVPLDPGIPGQNFRRDSEWLYGEGVGVSRAPLAMTEYAFRALRSLRRLKRIPLGVLFYTDEGRDCFRSGDIIRAAAGKAKRVLVIRPGNLEDKLISQRRGWRKYRFIVEDSPRRPGRASKRPEVLQWVCARMDDLSKLSSRRKKISVSAIELCTDAYPKLLPHRVTGTILISYIESRMPDAIEEGMKEVMRKGGYYWELELTSDRPPMKKRRANERLQRALARIAADWDISVSHESSLYPSVAGLVPSSAAVMCGVGPVAREIGTPQEAVQRLSLLRRTILLAEFLGQQLKK